MSLHCLTSQFSCLKINLRGVRLFSLQIEFSFVAMPVVLSEAAPGILLMRFRFPKLDAGLRQAVQSALLEANAYDACRALVIAGAEAPFAIDPPGDLSAHDIQEEFAMLRCFTEARHLTIAAVDGLAAGAGLALAMAADVRVAGPNSQFQFRLPGAGQADRLGHRVVLLGEGLDPARAMEIALSGKVLTALDAIRLGLARPAPPGSDFVGAVCSWAGELTADARGDASQLRRMMRLAVVNAAPGAH